MPFLDSVERVVIMGTGVIRAFPLGETTVGLTWTLTHRHAHTDTETHVCTCMHSHRHGGTHTNQRIHKGT